MQGWLLALLMIVPWYAFIAYHTGNPIWPMFPQFSRAPWGSPSSAATFEYWLNLVGVPKTLLNFVILPFHFTAHPELFRPERLLSPLLLAWPLAWVISIWNRSVRWWTLWALAYTVFWFNGAQFMRYWLPVVPLVGLALLESLGWVAERIGKPATLSSVIFAGLGLWAIISGAQVVGADLEVKGLPPATWEARRAFFLRRGLGFKGVEFVNRYAQAGDKVWIVNANRLTYYLQPRMVGYLDTSYEPSDRVTIRWPSNKEWVKSLEDQQVTWLFVFCEIGGKLPAKNPFQRPDGPAYELVYVGSQTYIFRRLPVPLEISQNKIVPNPPCATMATNNQSNRTTGRLLQVSHLNAAVGETAPAYEGYHDLASCESIAGWVWDAKQPGCSMSVDIYDGEKLLTQVLANELREDVAKTGKGNGFYGFTYSPPAHLRDGKPHAIRVKVSGTEMDLSSTPKSLACSPQSH